MGIPQHPQGGNEEEESDVSIKADPNLGDMELAMGGESGTIKDCEEEGRKGVLEGPEADAADIAILGGSVEIPTRVRKCRLRW